jgi:MGT family glycosyltransferase
MIPTFALAHQLKNEGYKVHYFGIADAMQAVQKEGFETHTVFETQFPLGGDISGASKSDLIQLMLQGELDDLMRKLSPDIIITTAHNPLETLILHYIYQIKTVLFWTYLPSSQYIEQASESPFVHMMQSDVQLMLFGHFPEEELQRLKDFIQAKGIAINEPQDIVKPFQEFSHFIACSKGFIPQKIENQTNEIYVGPCIVEHHLFELPEDTALQNLLEKSKSEETQILYVSLGTVLTKTAPKKAFHIFKALMDAMKYEKMKGYELILVAGDLYDLLQKFRPPANVHIYSWLPQVQLLKHVSLVITPGGMNSVKECIDAKVPMIVIPSGADQFENAKIITHHQLGIVLEPNNRKSNSFVEAITTVLHSETILSNVQKMHADFEQCTNAQNGLKHIESLLETEKEIQEKY